MKANIEGDFVEGTPEEIVAYKRQLKGTPGKEVTWKPNQAQLIADDQAKRDIQSVLLEVKGNRKNSSWTENEDIFLLEHPHKSAKWLAKKMVRTTGAILQRRSLLKRAV